MQLDSKSLSSIVSSAREFRPDIIGVSGMTIDSREIAALASSLKKEFATTPIIVGGAQATHNPESVMEYESVDFLITGEGEIGLDAYLEHFQGKRDVEEVPNLVFRRNGNLCHNPAAPFIEELDALPFPAYDLVDLERYFQLPPTGFIFAEKRYISVISSRGCPFGCSYCHNVHGRKYRYRSAEKVVEEMEQLIQEYGVGEFIILDDLFNFIPERVNRIAELIIERGMKIKLNLPTGLRADLMTEEGLRLLRKAGMYRCLFAVDSASHRIQKLTYRNSNVEKTLQMIDLACDLGVFVHGTFIIGFPTETEAEARRTIETALSSKLHTAAFHRAIPFHGTGLHRLAIEAGASMMADEEDFDFNKDCAALNASEISNELLVRLRREAYRKFYLSPKRMWSLFRLLPNKWQLLPKLFRLWVKKAITG